VLVPELVKQLGARRILEANAAASGGRPPTIVGNIASLMDGTIDRMPRAAAAAGGQIAGGRVATLGALGNRVPVTRLAPQAAPGTATVVQLDTVVAAVNQLAATVRAVSAPSGEVTDPIVRALARVERMLAARGPDTAATAQARRVNAELGGLR
jgi:hypothetical protein